MAKSFTGRKRIRKSFGRIEEIIKIPNLIEVQRQSYETFLQKDFSSEKRESVGIQEVFASVFPIQDFAGRAVLDFVRYEFEPPKYDIEECQQRDLTYSAPLKVTLRLSVFDIDEDTAMTTKYQIRGVPTLIVLEDGKEVKRMSGVKKLDDLKQWLES